MIKNLKIKRRAYTILAGLHLFGNPSSKMKVVGVTGTNGKTTTTTLLYRIATELGYKAGLIGTVENMIAGERVKATHTTPDPVTLNKLLNNMLSKGCEYVFMEVSSHALDQKRVNGVHFTGGIFTNLTHDHLDYHKNIENYFFAKKRFFTILPKNAFALSNTDDAYGKRMLENIKARKFTYGFTEGEDFHGEIKKLSFEGLDLKFNDTEVRSKLLGKFNAFNLLSVWSASSLLGFNMVKVGKILENIAPPRGRFEHFMSPTGVLIIIDYAHTPDALEKVLLVAKETNQSKGKLISVFGCGGDRDPMKRPIMGNLGASLSDVAIFTSDNPRTESPSKILGEMEAGLSHDLKSKVKIIVKRKEAIAEAVKIAKEGDIILCAGKGHEDYQEVNGVKYPFDDMEEFKKAYEGL
jgi:UDP-N-acetylmuramoyl-L-alanyl-D-glutamate--2,6-diaminopimelate ligase